MANQELIKASDWFKANKLTLNVSKTKYILFRSKTQEHLDLSQLDIQIQGGTKYPPPSLYGFFTRLQKGRNFFQLFQPIVHQFEHPVVKGLDVLVFYS